MIITFTGASGAGKTSIARHILKLPNATIVPSYTTRARRDSDIPGEYKYLMRFCFRFMELSGLFLWTVDIHGNKYGTAKHSVNKAFNRYDDIFVMILTPDKVAFLLDYERSLGFGKTIMPFFIISPPADILRDRLKQRGEAEILRRLKECENWDAESASSGIPYIYEKNDGEITDVVSRITGRINKEFEDQIF